MRKFLVTLSLVAVGCGGSDSVTGASGEITGTYTLQTVNGAALPVTVFTLPGYTLRLTGGNIVITSATEFTARYDWQETDAGETVNFTADCAGIYSRTGNNLIFSEVDSGDFCGGSYSATWNGSTTLTVSFGTTIQAVYVR